MNVCSSDDASAQPKHWSRVATGLRRTSSRVRRSSFALLSTLLTTTCVDGLKPLNDGPAPATKIEELTDAVAARYTTPERSGRFETARRRLVAGALVPSRAYADTTIWSAMIPP